MTMTNSNNTVPIRRKKKILDVAMELRSVQASCSEAFDPLRFIEHQIPKMLKDFDYDYWEEDPHFLERPDRKAFVDFTDGVRLVVRESVMEGAYRGEYEDRFALAHEIGHIFLHRRKAKTILSRHKVGSNHQYTGHPVLEIEANLFGGTLLAPCDGVSPLMNLFEVKRKFNCSSDVARRAIEDAKFWRANSNN